MSPIERHCVSNAQSLLFWDQAKKTSMPGPVSIDIHKHLPQVSLFNAEENTFTSVTVFGLINN